MKKSAIIAILFICVSFSPGKLYSQNVFTGGSFTLNPGIGFGYSYGNIGSFYPAVSVSGDYGLKVNAGPGTIGVGGILGFKLGHYDYAFNNYSASYTETILAVRGTYHWTPSGAPQLDLFGGIPIGVRFDHYSKWNYNYDKSGNIYYKQVIATETDPFFGFFVGVSYYFTNKVGAFAEVGYDVSALTLGLSFKIK